MVCTLALAVVSRLPVGSSARINSGSLASARAMATRWLCPPESCLGSFFASPARPRLLNSSAARLEHARAMADLGAALRRAGQRADSREILRTALDLAHRCEARALTERTHTELIAAGGRPRRLILRGLDSLTPSERRVAQLAAAGVPNRDIAQHLFITTRTVEGHLTHAYQKLAITSREHLPSALASRDLETTAPASTVG